MLESNQTLLFQGDSITDAQRDRDLKGPNDLAGLGRGYAMLTSAALLRRLPGLSIYNRGIGGNRVTQLVNRWGEDCLALNPDVVSILIGVNDTWHGVARGNPENGVPLEEFDRVYRTLLDDTRAALPNVKLVIGEPFVVEAGAVLELNFHPDIDQRRELVQKIAEDYADAFVPYQRVYDEAIAGARTEGGTRAEAGGDPAYWAYDGVHPTLAGHQLMAEAWLQAVGVA